MRRHAPFIGRALAYTLVAALLIRAGMWLFELGMWLGERFPLP